MLTNYTSSNKADRVKQKVKDKRFLIKIVHKITEYKGKPLLQNEIEGLVHYVNGLNFELLQNDLPGDIVNKIAKAFANQLIPKSVPVIDNHEIMKKQIGTISYNKNERKEGFGSSDEEELTLYNSTKQDINKFPMIKKQNVQNVYLCLDSMERNLSTDPSVFKWTVLQSNNTQQGTVNTLSDNIHNIINIQFNKFRIPYVASAANVYERISVFIEEFSNQSVIIRSQRRYHMMFAVEVKGNMIELTPDFNDEGRFRFHTPLNILDTITMQFQSPFVPITFQKDRFNVSISTLNPTQSILTFSENHEVSDGELVHITKYTTASPNIDAVSINTINRESGHIVTFINNTTLRIDINLTGVTADPTNLATCFIATRRLIIPVRLEYLV